MKRIVNLPIIIAVFSLMLSCSDSDNDAQNPVAGSWRIASIKVSNATLVQLAPPNEDITISFQADNTFVGSTSVNQFSGDYELENTTLTLLSFTTTEVADTQFGTAFYGAITEAQVPNTTVAQLRFQFDSGDLILTFGDGGELVLEP